MKNPYPEGTLNARIWSSLYYYPSLYHHGGLVLHHLYCVIGGGDEWNNGRLTDLYVPDEDKSPYRDTMDMVSDGDLALQFEIDRLYENHRIDFVRKYAKRLTLDVHRDWDYLYSISDYANLNHVPDDVQDDFLVGARIVIDHAYGVIAKHGCRRSHVTKDHKRVYHDSAASSIDTLDKALQSIIKRFGPNPLGATKTGYKLWTCFNDFVKINRELNTSMKKTMRKILDGIDK